MRADGVLLPHRSQQLERLFKPVSKLEPEPEPNLNFN